MHAHYRSILILSSLLLSCAKNARADYEPIELTPDSYTHDVVVENTATPPVVPVTTASMDEGSAASGYTWYERGYLPDYPSTGLPEAGTKFTSDRLADHQYQMPGNYQANNAFFIDALRTNAVVTLVTSTNFTNLSLLTSSGSSKNILGYNLRHQDGTIQSGTFVSPNWYGDGDPAWAASGKVNVSSFADEDVNSYNPRLYSVDIAVSNYVSPVMRLEIWLQSGNGHSAIFALSGKRGAAEHFTPVEIAGYNEDLVVEASAVKPGVLETNTTATMENGTANTRFTWYERGYCLSAPQTGLPPAGSLLTSESDAAHHFRLPPSYATANAALLDGACTNCLLTPLVSSRYSALSFLTASAYGPVTNRCITRYANGTSQTNSFISPDWLSNSPAAFIAHGRVSVSSKKADTINADAPRLFAVDLGPLQTNSSLTQIVLTHASGSPAAHAIVLAVSGVPLVPQQNIPPTLTIQKAPGGTINVRTDRPGRLQSCKALRGSLTVWTDEGAISQVLSLPLAPSEPARFYRVVIPGG